ncbi:phospholipase-like protein [Parathielavia hyrcaniae]|uniref:Lysophospholipase n=1 Tax=Parathielavia hyrcaniae TaxID=113614 RepID=A0AAN6T5C8_9PEZI|nr:phospholipase-like protein [Parathielavia hyrcaniae]
MHRSTIHSLTLLLPFYTSAEPLGIPRQNGDLTVIPRASPDAPSGGYAPAEVSCPAERPTIRLANSLSESETEWLEKRRPLTVDPMIDFLTRANIEGFDAEAYIREVADDVTDLPNIGIAVSGGGYRALMNGAGFVAAADSRTPGTTDAGGIGGLLQSATYLAGLSGGGWLVSSIYANNFSAVETLRTGREDSSIWNFADSIFVGPNLPGFFDTPRYWAEVAGQVSDKDDAGFETSITDYWGRALAYQLIDAPDGGPAYTYSSIANGDDFSNGRAPFPILVADSRYPGERIVSLNATVFEFNPFEMGSWDPTTFGFAPTRYLASNFSGGVVPSDGQCIRGFDSLSFIFGTSSSLFNAFLLANISAVEGVPSFLIDAVTGILESLDDSNNDIAQYAPNPFLGWNNDSNPNSDEFALDLVDGGMDLQNIPLHPLLQPVRAVDVIFAVDSSADTVYAWPNGTALRATYERSLSAIANGTQFPAVPDDATFLALGLNNRPTFFGCDVANFSSTQNQTPPPLIVYLPNAPYTAYSNVSTFEPSFPDAQRDAIIRNGLDGATQGNGTLDGQWPTCVACAVLSRSWARRGDAVPAACDACFERYCWNGTTAAEAGAAVDGGGGGGAEYQPTLKIGGEDGENGGGDSDGPGDSGSVGRVVGFSGWASVVGLVVALMFL